jgi:hypothetical protein
MSWSSSESDDETDFIEDDRRDCVNVAPNEFLILVSSRNIRSVKLGILCRMRTVDPRRLRGIRMDWMFVNK